MPLVTSEKMLSDAQKGGYAVGAFNVENMEMAKAVIAAAEEMRSPVMLQTTPSTVKYGSLETFAAIVKAEASKTDIPVCLHLDHGNSFELAVQAMKAGYTSPALLNTAILHPLVPISIPIKYVFMFSSKTFRNVSVFGIKKSYTLSYRQNVYGFSFYKTGL